MNVMQAINMMNRGLLIENIKTEMPLELKTEPMMSDYMDTDARPIDLSRRCDSVETRKTPSPYNSSGFSDRSPSLKESPTSLPRSLSSFSSNRSDSPTNRYQSATFLQQSFSADSLRFSYENERTPSPSDSIAMHRSFMRQPSLNSSEDEIINPYILHAVALQQKLQAMPTPPMEEQLSPESMKYPMVVGRDGKLARPFKAYPQDPLSSPFGSVASTDSIGDLMSAERYDIFRQQMLKQIHAANGGQSTVCNPKMRRISTKPFGEGEHKQQNDFEPKKEEHNNSDSSNGTNGKDNVKDDAYFERRRKNNAAAKKSRDRRRIKEDEIAIRASYLERENFELRIELAAAKRELAKLLGK